MRANEPHTGRALSTYDQYIDFKISRFAIDYTRKHGYYCKLTKSQWHCLSPWTLPSPFRCPGIPQNEERLHNLKMLTSIYANSVTFRLKLSPACQSFSSLLSLLFLFPFARWASALRSVPAANSACAEGSVAKLRHVFCLRYHGPPCFLLGPCHLDSTFSSFVQRRLHQSGGQEIFSHHPKACSRPLAVSSQRF